MNVGAMRDDVTLQTPSGLTADGYADVGTVPAAIVPASGSGTEALRFGAPIATGFYRITMRYRTDLKADWRLVDQAEGRVFHINSYETDRFADELRLFCTQVNL